MLGFFLEFRQFVVHMSHKRWSLLYIGDGATRYQSKKKSYSRDMVTLKLVERGTTWSHDIQFQNIVQVKFRGRGHLIDCILPNSASHPYHLQAQVNDSHTEWT